MSEATLEDASAGLAPADEVTYLAADRKRKVISWRAIGLGAFLIVFTGVYFYLATHIIHQVNDDPAVGGQERSLRLAEEGRGGAGEEPVPPSVTEMLWSYLPRHTDGVVDPLWPWIAGKFAADDRAVSFERGKWFHFVVSGAFCCILGLWASRVFSLAATLNLVTLAGFAVFLERSGYFEPEPLYYILFFLSWVCCILALRRNSIWIYALLGVLFGLAYLTKASAMPLLVIFVTASTLHWIESLLFFKRRLRKGEPAGRWAPQNHFIGLAFLAAGFLVVSGARLHYARDAFGNPWQSYPAQWMWMDDRAEALEFFERHPDGKSLGALGRDELPSLANHLATHSPVQVRERLLQGIAVVGRQFFRPQQSERAGDGPVTWREVLPLRGYYLAVLFIMLCMVGCAAQIAKHHDHRPVKAESRSARLVVVFFLAVSLVYVAGYAWYARIEHGDKFLMMLYLPLVFSFIWGAERFIRSVRSEEGRKAIGRGYTAIHLILLGAIAYRVAEIVREPVFTW